MPTFYRCGACDLNFPDVSDPRPNVQSDRFIRCGRCDAPTAVMNVDKADVLTVEEAESIVRHAAFDKFCEAEKPTDREARWLRYDQRVEDERERQRKQFDAVIADAGFTPAEIERLDALEGRLPMVHPTTAAAMTQVCATCGGSGRKGQIICMVCFGQGVKLKEKEK